MPVSQEGVNWIGVLRVMIFCILLVVCVGLISGVPDIPDPLPVPTPILQPTNTLLPSNQPAPVSRVIAVSVADVYGNPIEPSADIVVRVSDSQYAYRGGEGGQFTLESCAPNQYIFAWAPGYEIQSVPCAQSPPYNIALNRLQAIDNPNYAWSSATGDCNQCHGNPLIANPVTGASFDEMNEWFRSAHAKVFQQGYFASIYRGTTLDGKPSQPARPVIIANEWVPVPPEISQDYHGPGFRLDHSQQPGNCAYCHAPAAIRGTQESVALDNPKPGGVWGEGVTCDVCHKVFDVVLADNGFPFTDRPGVLSFQFLRPSNGIFMTGPFSNMLRNGMVAPANHRSTCSPIFSRSEFCAPCHFGKFGDMVVYNSYGEWKASAYAANPADPGYRTCQDCHMSHLPVGDTGSMWSERQACSANNTRFQNFNHNMMNYGPVGSENQIPLMVQNAADIGLGFDHQAANSSTFDVIVGVTNIQAGHNFPTDSPLRHLILIVTAVDRVGTTLMQVGGGQIPNWAGPGLSSPIHLQQRLRNTGVEDYSGLPGKVFANLLVEEETNLSPGVAYWNETKFASQDSDNRLRPGVTDSSAYSFSIPDSGNVQITVKLIYRFAFYDLLVQKEWFDRPDIIVATWECKGPPTQPEILRGSCKKIAP